MATPAEEITLDLDAIDAETAKNAEKKPDTPEIKVSKADPAAAKPEKPVVTPEEGLETLRKQLEVEKSARLAAESRANEAAQGEARARGEVQTTQLDMIKGAIERVTQTNDALEEQYANAMAAQDWKGAAKAQRQMADNSAKLAQLEAGKAALEKAPKPTPRVPYDPVEKFAAELSAPSAAWVRAHPEFVRDAHKNRLMIAAHEVALAKGHKADTPEYFQSIEKTLDITPAVTKPDPVPNEEHDPMADAAQAVNGRGRTPAAPAAAPVSRGGNGNGSRPNRVTLTADEVEMAAAMNMTPEEYARNKVALKKEGKLS
jgi:hypothetical protein